MEIKVLWITNMPTIYRVHFFNELGKYCNLTVMFERYSATGVKNKWNNSLAKNFTPVFHRTIDIGREGAFGLDLLKVNYKEYDEVVVSSYSSPAEMLLLLKLKMQKIPYILEVDGGMIKTENTFKTELKKFLISGADLYFSSSNMTTKYLEYYGANKNNIVKYHFSSLFLSDIMEKVSTKEEKLIIKQNLGLRSCPMVLAVGQFIYRKGFDVLIRATAKMSTEIQVVIIGGEPTDEYKSLINELKLNNVMFISELPKEKLAEYYKASDVFVLPTREDIWGLVINEAAAKGLPIITTNNCIAGVEIIENGVNGYIVDVDDYESLTEKVEEIVNNVGISQRMSEENLIRIKSYTIENMAKEHYDMFCRRKNAN